MILQQHQPVSRDRHHYHRIRSDLLRQSLATQRKDIRPLEEARTWSCLATVSVVGAGRDQRLQVDMSDFPDPRYHPYYGFARYPTPSVSESTLDIDQLSISSHKTSRKGCSHDRKSARPSCRPQPHEPHPYGLDSTQAGIEFVLRLEKPCLRHIRRNHSHGPSGHTLTVQASLLAYAPRNLENNSSWQIPAGELERLLEPSAAPQLDGELTPVQAWHRVKRHPGFSNITPDRFNLLCDALLEQGRCFGFGTVIDEVAFTETLYGLLSA
ncbi:hypothetical protein DTO271D3_8705 [Paecilomyces variotii]|nr:hypothetical protein DTO271D3_8705 [Paecilomyces variotii]KAJ9403807.1 hypothetical protein DTO045G8_8459 [Paecilomyces variotii]